MNITQVKKRNGVVVNFVANKISRAISRAFAACETPLSAEQLMGMTATILAQIEECACEQIPSVECIEDIVELVIMNSGFHKVAKAYIIYRYEHQKIRQEEVAQKIEGNELFVTKRSLKIEKFSLDKLKKFITHSTKGYEQDIDIDLIVNQCQKEIYDKIKTEDIAQSLIMVCRSMIEIDPAYSKLASRLLLDTIYKEVIGADLDYKKFNEQHRQIFIKNIRLAVEAKLLSEEILNFDLEKLSRHFMLFNDDRHLIISRRF